MNRAQLRDLIVVPTMKKIPRGYSHDAVLAFMMCVAHESKRGEYVRQNNCCGNVGAFGLIQMEKLTHDQTWIHKDGIYDLALTSGIITKEMHASKKHPSHERLIYDLEYNVFMFRVRMFMKVEPFPEYDRIEMSKYLKKHWNSIHGAADEMSYLKDYEAWK